MSKLVVRRALRTVCAACVTMLMCLPVVVAPAAAAASEDQPGQTRIASIKTTQNVLPNSLLAPRQDATPRTNRPGTQASDSAALPLFAGGLALIGFLAWRRKTSV